MNDNTDTAAVERENHIPKRLKDIHVARKRLNYNLARHLLDNAREYIDTELYVFESAMLEYESNPKSRYSAMSKLWNLITVTRSEKQHNKVSSTLVRSCLKLAKWLCLVSEQDDFDDTLQPCRDDDDENESRMRIETCLICAESYSRNEGMSFSLRSKASVHYFFFYALHYVAHPFFIFILFFFFFFRLR